MQKLRFFNLHDFLISVVPGLLTIHSSLKEFQLWIALALGIVVLVLFVLLIVRKNIVVYKKEIADILANGYFINFLDNLSNNLQELKNEIVFEDKRSEYFDLEKISVEIFIPSSNEQLFKVADQLNSSKNLENVYLKNRNDNSGFWLRAKKVNDVLVINDFPRTLFSLPKYLKNELGEEYDERKSIMYHKVFIDKVKKLVAENTQNRTLAAFSILVK